jgi:methyltransferase (TIGR00027 family)
MWGLAAVAASPALASVVPPESAELTRRILERESFLSRVYLRFLRYGWFRPLAFGVQRAIAPGIFLHFALRKRFIEDAVRRALADGYRQVVVLGAGLDTLSLRLHREFPEVAFVEVDHPASQAAKRRLLPVPPGENLRFVPLDLATPDLESQLRAAIEDEPRTVFVAEGLTMYLPEAAVRSLFAILVHVAPATHLVFTALSLTPAGVPDFRHAHGIVHWWLAHRRESFRWGVRPADVPAFLDSLGLRLRTQAGPAELRHAHLPESQRHRPVAEGEYLYEARAAGG